MNYSWKLGKCKTCKGEMIREVMPIGKHRVKVWVCKRCGYTRGL